MMGKFKEMEIEAQDAVISDYDAMYEVMPVREPTDAELNAMLTQECLLQIEAIEAQINEMLFRFRYYKEGFEVEDMDRVIVALTKLKRTIQ